MVNRNSAEHNLIIYQVSGETGVKLVKKKEIYFSMIFLQLNNSVIPSTP